MLDKKRNGKTNEVLEYNPAKTLIQEWIIHLT